MVRHLVWLCLLFGFQTPLLYAQGMCGPSALGQPCAYGGIATQGSAEPALNLGVGNPVHLATGNKYQHDVDLPANLSNPLLELSRHYNAMDRRQSAFGVGWTSSYDTRLYWAGGRWQIVQADGSRITLRPDERGQPRPGPHGTLDRTATGWRWTWPTGYRLYFDKDGYLTKIATAAPESRRVYIERHGHGELKGALARLRTPDFANIVFHYQRLGGQFYVDSIDTPAGRFSYHYTRTPGTADPAPSTHRLTTVVRPDGMQRHYLYEAQYQSGNAGHLTGIEIRSADGTQSERLASWSYDATGRAITYTAGASPAEPTTLSIRYLQPATSAAHGVTEVNNRQGASLRLGFRAHEDRYVLVDTTKTPCTGCTDITNYTHYDAHGRLSALNKTRLKRGINGQIEQLQPEQHGWPGLTMTFNPQGMRARWYAEVTGTEHADYNDRKQLATRRFANGDAWMYVYDKAGRLKRLVARNLLETHTTRLDWRDNHLVRIRHPHETEVRQYDSEHRLKKRTVIRPPAPGTQHAVIQTDRFDFNVTGRITHHLPEGGALHYRFSNDQRLLSIDWEDKQGVRTPVIHGHPSEPGYRYGNGLWLRTLWHHGRTRMLVLQDGQKAVWTLHQHADAQQRLTHETQRFEPAGHSESWRYGYDGQSRLVTAHNGTLTRRHAWHEDGSAAAFQIDDATHRAQPSRDASGLPTSVQGYTLHYGPNRRLEQVKKNGKTVDRYRHNAFGHRVLAINQHSRTHYLYLDNRVVAEMRQSPGHAERPSAVTRRYIYAHDVPVGLIDYSAKRPQGTLYAIHADLIGVPRLITDQNKTVRWLASYSPHGRAIRIEGDLTFNLRLPGQIYDETTGWHDNLLRTYHPEFGHYLEPDPLGPIPGNQAYGYAAQQPRRFTDPTGLILFAFDGTRNNATTRTNIWKMSQRYLDGPAFYHTGPGSPNYIEWDAISAGSALQTVQNQWNWLLNELEKAGSDEIIPIDIIGYSRGAALARHFGNQINQHVDQGLFSYNHPMRGLITACVDLRFMGLFDTVSQFGLGGINNSEFDLTIAATWGWVAHAVALHERRWLFPLSTASAGGQANITEAPFIGAHADIGGGLAYSESGSGAAPGDLSDVALNWMLWQARAAALRFSTGDPSDAEVSNPILHDQRTVATRIINTDRRADAPDGSPWYAEQNEHPTFGDAQRQMTEELIRRHENWRLENTTEVGTVDLDGYAKWLHHELGWRALPS